ncbi:Dpy-30 motif family protein [Trichomonas vaginalis G3]|uniref:Dpy-30 motif family protein n=1 Tax=Trichomonas vaginalis (strain ATCC PRA-98 / G3) TaxID=412133 RepID=A2EUP1_TRIV3|nr:Dpy-30 motif-containing protein [Trichomonas vaginalis G3]EAY03629.1 Dpy-30 motif family protein [Trichomonas vaginalis G3]KAI5524724.1 Dpy-30 motif-containing protein [Trichomonas vaginalis G3]|eukprot:XP_001315852.1 Dpy-30 motif family protein [Trichomonas vaginalis G3]
MSARDSTPTSGNISAPPQSADDSQDIHAEQAQQTDEEELKQYLGDTLIPLLAYGMDELERIRPPDPVLFLAHFLLRHNPRRSNQ